MRDVMASRGWTCRKCSYLNKPAHRKCRGTLIQDGTVTFCTAPKPKRRVAPHARVLRDTSYQEAETLSQKIHGGERGSCGVCGRPRGERNHDRDHDHRTGDFRGLACWKCNRELLRGHTVETLRACLAYLERAERV
jgi:hypothetical protein